MSLQELVEVETIGLAVVRCRPLGQTAELERQAGEVPAGLGYWSGW